MNFVGIDLHKKTISICVVDQERSVLHRKRLNCCAPDRLVAFLEPLGPFEAAVEAISPVELGITQEGSTHLRWVLVEAAWQLVRRTRPVGPSSMFGGGDIPPGDLPPPWAQENVEEKAQPVLPGDG